QLQTLPGIGRWTATTLPCALAGERYLLPDDYLIKVNCRPCPGLAAGRQLLCPARWQAKDIFCRMIT
ncbi:hypothetical protein CQA86_32765, partial [Klebsiella pneumoniae]